MRWLFAIAFVAFLAPPLEGQTREVRVRFHGTVVDAETLVPVAGATAMRWVGSIGGVCREALERLWRAEVLRLLVERGKIGQEVVESLPKACRDLLLGP